MTAATSVWEPLRVRIAGARWHTALVTWGAVMLASVSVQPLLDGGWWIARTGIVVAGVLAIGGLVRTARLPSPLQPVLQAVGLVVLLALLFTDPEPGWGWLPGPADLAQLRDLAAEGREYAMVTVPPASAHPGLLLLVAGGVGLIALAVDTLAAGLDLPGLTLVPLGSLYVVPWAINRGWSPAWAFAAVAFGWFGILATTQRDRARLWTLHARPGSTATALGAAGLTTVLALAAGGLGSLRGPALPVDLGSGIGEGAVQIDALVSLRRSLVSNDDRVILTYATSAQGPDYLRLAVLEQFDGVQWLPAGGLGAGSAELGPQPPPGPDASAVGAGAALVDYRLDIGPLAGTTLPSPAGTIASPNDFPVAWDQRTSLPIRTDGRTVEGTRAALVVQPLAPGAEALRAASVTAPAAGLAPPPETRDDPAGLVGDELASLARDITRGAATPFDRAVALQRWFTIDGGFRYSTQVQAGAGEDALAAFLDERIGYCEQFSATMALMARSLGIPARVVVGFTQGRPEGTQWVVRGTDAHAWPELWMGSAGWVRFEPTPGAVTATRPTYTQGAPATTAPTAAPTAAPSAPEASDRPDRPAPLDEQAGGRASTAREGLSSRAVLAVLAGLVLLVPAVARTALRARRRRRGGSEDAYREVTDTLVDLRLGAELATPRATLAGIRAALAGAGPAAGPASESLDRIQRAIEWQRYGGPASVGTPVAAGTRGEGSARPGTAVVERDPAGADPRNGTGPRPGALNDDVRAVRRALAARAGAGRRVRAALAPASLLGAVASRLAGPDRDAPGAG